MIKKILNYKKTFSIGSVFILFILFILTVIILLFIRNIRADGVVSEIIEINNEIKKLQKQKSVLIAEEKQYGAPSRFIEIGLQSGLIEPRGEDDILYIEINNQKAN